MSEQATVDQGNREFWQHICGTRAAELYGYDGDDAASIANFDKWFFGYYPYLDQFIPFDDLAGQDALEIGLGYGSVSQRIARAGARLTGLDIASAPVHWFHHRLALNGLTGTGIQGTALDMPFRDESFDYVVTIGCLHHTGNLKAAISEVHRVLRRGGRATIMVYNATSYMRWLKYPSDTLSYVREVMMGSANPLPLAENGRAFFDADPSGNIAPEVVLSSKTSFSRMLMPFSTQKIYRTNVYNHPPIDFVPRNLLNALVGPLFGSDLYALVTK